MTLIGHFPETYPTKIKIAHKATLPAARKTAPDRAALEFRCPK